MTVMIDGLVRGWQAASAMEDVLAISILLFQLNKELDVSVTDVDIPSWRTMYFVID